MAATDAPARTRPRRTPGALSGALVALMLATGPAGAQAPLSAIDWLSPSVAPEGMGATGPASRPAPLPAPSPAPGVSTRQTPPGAWTPPRDARRAPRSEPPVARNGGVGPVTTLRLGEANPETIGLMPAAQAGLPDDLWVGSAPADLVALIGVAGSGWPPAVQGLLRRALVARLRPAPGAGGQVFLARVDRLLDLGALDAAQGLLDGAGPGDIDRFRRRFDVALLTGNEARACAVVQSSPGIAPSLPVRIFCLARSGDWNAAMNVFSAASALGRLDPEMHELILRFLEPELADGAAPLAITSHPTPLAYKMLEAIGEPLPTASLPLAFAQADLSANTGWRAQIEAAERLARAGSIRPDRLFTIYGQQKAAASGGVWDRVAAVAALHAALEGGDAAAIGAALDRAWDRLAPAGLLPVLAEHVAPRLRGVALSGGAADRAWRLALMAPEGAEGSTPAAPEGADPLLAALAGDGPMPEPGANATPLAQAVTAGLAPEADPGQTARDLLAGGRRGEAFLAALSDLAEGAGGGDPRRLSAGLATLVRLNLTRDARAIARQVLILDAARG